MSDRGRDVSHALTQARTVLSRAETGAADLRRARVNRWEWGDDPDAEEIIAALEQVVDLLDKWRRTGRPKKGQR